MNFGEKLRELRLKKKMTQAEFGEALGITNRTVINYETGKRIPKDMSFYKKVSARFGIALESLITEKEEFAVKAYAEGGLKEMRKAEALIAEAGALFAGGELTEEDKEAVFMALQEAYWFAKSENKKYRSKRPAKK